MVCNQTPQNHSGMLYCLIWVEKGCSNYTHLLSPHFVNHALKPSRINRLYVVV